MRKNLRILLWITLVLCFVLSGPLQGATLDQDPIGAFFPDQALAQGVADTLSLDVEDILTTTDAGGLLFLSSQNAGIRDLQGISILTNLRSLTFIEEDLTTLPEEILELPSLSSLNLQGNPLEGFPGPLSELIDLTALNLDHTGLYSVPEGIGSLTRLRSLSLAGNQLTTLPEGLWNLTQLETLHLEDNRLTTLPRSITQLGGLTNLVIDRNAFMDIPLEAYLHLVAAGSILRDNSYSRSIDDPYPQGKDAPLPGLPIYGQSLLFGDGNTLRYELHGPSGTIHSFIPILEGETLWVPGHLLGEPGTYALQVHSQDPGCVFYDNDYTQGFQVVGPATMEMEDLPQSGGPPLPALAALFFGTGSFLLGSMILRERKTGKWYNEGIGKSNNKGA